MLPASLDRLRVEWRKRGSYETAWVTPGHDCLCSYAYGHGAAVRTQTNDSSWDGVIGLWSRVAPILSPWCARGNVPTGVNLNRYFGSDSCIPWHSESLFGPQNQPKLIVSMSLGYSVEFQVRRRAPGEVPSSIQVDHGDLLVMDGLQGPRVNLTYRWVTHHTASCPLTGAMYCALPACVQGLAGPGPPWLGTEDSNWAYFWVMVGVSPRGVRLG